MIKKFFLILLSCLTSLVVTAQHKLSGKIVSNDSLHAVICHVYLDSGAISTMTNSHGYFEFKDLPDGKYVLHTSSLEYKPLQRGVTIEGRSKHLHLTVYPGHSMFEEVVVEQAKPNTPYMKAVESMGIYEGKKSEVIIPDKLVANLATNNARQIYSRVAGLNIWENDGAGLQLSIGGRGLDPNRSSNFNVRQNGYDISADALGYPESYYTPTIEAIDRIQLVRGAASLQYGTQFGGLLNFVLRKPVTDKKIQLVVRQTGGSFGFYNSFTSLSGTVGKFSYYTFYQYKRGDGWRPNSGFYNNNFYSNINYKFSEKTTVGLDITHTDYLSQQPGGLSDAGFKENPRLSNRERNWFKVNWNIVALHFNHKFNLDNEFNLRLFGLSAYRYSLGFRPNRVATKDDNGERDLIKGYFTNVGAEARYLKRYSVLKRSMVLLIGSRYYYGLTHSTQGQGSKDRGADFDYVPDNKMNYDYRFPNRNLAFFAENILYLNDKVSITPGVRYEYIKTNADGFYGETPRNLAGDILEVRRTDEFRTNARHLVLGGIGISYKPTYKINIYTNISQNYRSITFSDMRVLNPSFVIDPNLKDERGYSFDLGIRSERTSFLIYDVSLFYLNYNNRIGEILTRDNSRIIRLRKNIGQAAIMGIESYLEADLFRILFPSMEDFNGIVFANTAFTNSRYTRSELIRVEGNQVEFVPKVNIKTGLRVGYRKMKASFQTTYLSDQFSDATNEIDGGVSAVTGIIPAYSILDFSLSYEYRRFKIEGSINNLADRMYFTRRATGYPGPGILPSDGRSFYLTLQVKI